MDAVSLTTQAPSVEINQSTPQLKETAVTKISTDSTEQEQIRKKAVANYLSMQISLSMSQGSSMIKEALGKADESMKEYKKIDDEEEQAREVEFGMSGY